MLVVAVGTVTQAMLVEWAAHATKITSRVEHSPCTEARNWQQATNRGQRSGSAQLVLGTMEADLGKEAPKLLDADTLIDEILAKKGPQEYKGGLSEENWEQVGLIKFIS